MQQFIDRIHQFVIDRFYLMYDQANMSDTLATVNDWISFRGTNMWVLIMAIIICSVGLNMNSTAVVIGAMLLSPLMGPIIALWVGLARYDLEMVTKSMRNLLLAAVVSVIIATCYFTISPLTSPTSEIIARTSPTIWDVIIAVCGWVAGIIAVTRKEKSLTVFPGVAIATALMPPLCTAWFGIANGMWMFAWRALYLFCINGVFIAAATYMMSRYIRFPNKRYSHTDASIPIKVKMSLWLVMIIMLVPSVLWGADIVRQNLLDNNIDRFIAQEVVGQWWQIITQQVDYDSKMISLWVIWSLSDADLTQRLQWQLSWYQLWSFGLSINKWLPSEAEIQNQFNTVDQLSKSLQNMKNIIEQQQQWISQIEKNIKYYPELSVSVSQLYDEIKIIYPQLGSMTASIVQSSTVWDWAIDDLTGVDMIVTSGNEIVKSSGLNLFDTTTGATNIASNNKTRYIISLTTSGSDLTPWEKQAVQEWLQIRIPDIIIQQVTWN